MRPKIGSVIEFQTQRGLAYALYTYWHKRYGNLVRVFETFYAERPEDLNEVVRDRVRFTTFTPVAAGVRLKLIEIVGVVPVPEELQGLPMFRAGNYDSGTKTVGQWRLWDGIKKWRVKSLTREQWSYPILRISMPLMIVHLLETNWRQHGAVH